MASRQMNKRFAETVAKKAQVFFDRYNQEATPEQVVAYLLAHSLIPEQEVRRYLAIDRYPALLYSTDSKTAAIRELEEEVSLSERTLWNVIGTMQKRFRRDARISTGLLPDETD